MRQDALIVANVQHREAGRTMAFDDDQTAARLELVEQRGRNEIDRAGHEDHIVGSLADKPFIERAGYDGNAVKTVVAERFGGQVLDTMSIENLVSVPHTEGPKLAADLERHVGEYEVDMIRSQAAAGLSAGDDGLTVVDLVGGAALKGKTVVLATGARWRTMGVPGEEEYRNKGVTFCPHCDGPLFKGKRIAVIGGGNSGVEAAIDLAGIVGHVTLVEFMDEMRADEVLQRKLRSLPNVDIRLGTKTTEVVGDGGKVTGIVVEPRDGGEGETLALEGVFVQIGLLPNTEWLGDAVELSERGEIVIDGVGRTNLPGVFAAGDIVRGASLVVWGIRDGRDAAAAILEEMDAGATAVAAE